MADTTQPAPLKLLLNTKAAAAALDVSERTLWSITSPRGTLASVRIGKSVKYTPADLMVWIETQKGAAHE